MATDLEPQAKPAPKYETFVERQIARARGRIRALDAAALGLVFLLGTLAYGLTMTLLDRAVELPPLFRLTALLVYACAAVLFLSIAGFRLLGRRINPYYAARQIEQTLPGAKNSVVNWLDLRHANLPAAIRGALGQRAAKDLKQADLDRAISGRRTVWLGGAVLTLLVAVLVMYVLGGGQFLSLLERAFAPFKEVAIATRTTLTLLHPQGGDATVPLGRPVKIRVRVEGRVPHANHPDALKLHYRYNPTDPFIEQVLELDADNEWVTTVLADQVQNGFWYKISGGDAETPEYQVRVRALPQVTRFDVKYHYRPYRNRPDQLLHYPNEEAVLPHLTAHRGTEVTLTARANRPVKKGRLEMELDGVKKELLGELVAGEPEALRIQFTLERSGTYQVLFTSSEGEPNTDRNPYHLTVVPDRAPEVILTEPGKDVELPANGTLQLAGKAEDDFGIKNLTLRLRVEGGPVLAPKVYRAGKSFRLVNGDYADKLDYKDFVALDKLTSDAGAAVPLSAGMRLKYWLEATDNCDYPDKNGNVGRSKEYLVKITDPTSDRKQQQEQRQQAGKEQQQHEQQQDKKLAEQNQKAKEKQDRQAADQQDASPQQKAAQQKEFENKAKQLENAVQEKAKQDSRKGQAKGDNTAQAPGASKERGNDKTETKPGDSKKNQPSAQGDAGKQKDDGKNGQQANKGQGKDSGQPQSAPKESPQGQAKDGGKDGAGDKKASAKDDGAGSKQNSAAQGPKGAGKEKPQDKVGQGKDQGKKDQQTGAGQSKDGGKENAPSQKADGKDGGKDKGQQKALAKDDGKGNAGAPQQARSDSKARPKDQVAQARDPKDAAQKPETSQAKGPGQPQDKHPPAQGQVKGPPAAEPKGVCKNGGGDAGAGGQKAGARDAGSKGSAPQAASKQAPPDQARDAGQAKGDSPPGDRTRTEEATMEDVARLQESLKRGKEPQGAADALSGISKEARDPQVRKAAADALKQAGAQAKGTEPGKGADKNSSPDKVASATNPKGDGPPDKGSAKAGPQNQGTGQDPGNGKASKPTTAKEQRPKGKQPGGVPTQPGTGAFQDDYKKQPGNEDFARRGGVLQLEDLKKKVTPDILKKLNWTPQDWQRFQEQARRYEAGLKRQQQLAGKDKVRPGSSLLPSTGPRKVGTGPDAHADDLSTGQALPPPEFREAQRIFTSRPEGTSAPGKQ